MMDSLLINSTSFRSPTVYMIVVHSTLAKKQHFANHNNRERGVAALYILLAGWSSRICGCYWRR